MTANYVQLYPIALIDLKDAKADLKWTFENIIEAYDNFKSLNIMSDTLVCVILCHFSLDLLNSSGAP